MTGVVTEGAVTEGIVMADAAVEGVVTTDAVEAGAAAGIVDAGAVAVTTGAAARVIGAGAVCGAAALTEAVRAMLATGLTEDATTATEGRLVASVNGWGSQAFGWLNF